MGFLWVFFDPIRRASEKRDVTNIIRASDYQMIAKVARSIASDADRRNSENPCHRKVKQVVGIGVRVWRQGICHAKEISVAACRIRISLVMDSVIIPIVGVDAAADCLDIV